MRCRQQVLSLTHLTSRHHHHLLYSTKGRDAIWFLQACQMEVEGMYCTLLMMVNWRAAILQMRIYKVRGKVLIYCIGLVWSVQSSKANVPVLRQMKNQLKRERERENVLVRYRWIQPLHYGSPLYPHPLPHTWLLHHHIHTRTAYCTPTDSPNHPPAAPMMMMMMMMVSSPIL